MLSDSELIRYDRQIRIEGFGKEGQEKLKKAKVFIAGGGGLGSASSIYLVAAGVGTGRSHRDSSACTVRPRGDPRTSAAILITSAGRRVVSAVSSQP